MMRTEDYEKVLDFLSMLQENNQHYSDRVINALKSVFNFYHTALFVKENSERYPLSHNLPKNVIEDYSSYFYKIDIFNIPILQQRKVVSIDDVMPYDQYLNTEYYQSFKRKYGFNYTVNVPINIGENTIGGIGIHRTKDEGDFTLADKLILANAAKFIAAGLDQSFKHNQLQMFNRTFIQSIELLPSGFILLDQKFSLLYYNSLAQEFCKDTSNKSIQGPVKAVVDMVISKCSMPILESGESYKLGRYHYRISPIPVPLAKDSLVATMYCIYIDEEKEPFENSLKIAKDLFGLSKRETEIVRLIAEGYSNVELADLLFLSINTVKSHINNIFNKLDVNKRTAIVHRINSTCKKP
ncbi:response regulator transcription factor [Neobacillus niacini]|uniref:response regulator transcription factor n=1 Tax=Neobacillus niacini TaxID=86668 RepID=UPI002FFD9CB6